MVAQSCLDPHVEGPTPGKRLCTLATHSRPRHDCRMGSGRTRSTTPDLFSTASARVPSLPSPNSPSSLSAKADGDATAWSRRHVLPKDLPGAIKQLEDQELDRLLAAVLAEQKRRDRKPSMSVETQDRPRIEAAAVHLTAGKMNAVRAAFKAGVKPSQIARQFGLSQSDVRKALASDASRRAPNRE
jgi:hypothetical protein